MAERIELTHPIQANGEQLSVLELRRPKVKDLKALDQATGEVERVSLLIVALASIPPSSVDEIDAEDFARIAEVVGGFLGHHPPTGGT